MVSPLSEVVGGLCYTKQDNKSYGIGCHSPQVGFDDAVSKPLDDLEGQLHLMLDEEVIPVGESSKLSRTQPDM